MYPNSKSKGTVTTAAQVNKDVTEKFRQILSSDVFTKLESVDQTYSSRFASGLAKTLCFINRKRHSIKNLSARILVITCGMDHLADQYLSLINGAFAAQDMNIKIDSVLIEREGTNAALQQVNSVVDNLMFVSIVENSIYESSSCFKLLNPLSVESWNDYWTFFPDLYSSCRKSPVVSTPKFASLKCFYRLY